MKKQSQYPNQPQRSHLKERLANALRERTRSARELGNNSKPPKIKAIEKQVARLQKIVSKYDDRAWKLVRARENSIRAEHDSVMEKILFSEPQEALRLVKNFEQAAISKAA